MTEMVRVLPHSVDAEKAVLGSVFIKPSVMDLLAVELQVDDFFMPVHREVFAAMLDIVSRRVPVDAISVADEMKARDTLKRMEGGEGYLLALANAVPTAENASYYLEVVRQRAQLRRVIVAALELASRAQAPDADASALLEEHSDRMMRIATGLSTDLVPASDLVNPLMDEFEQRWQRSQEGESAVTGIRTGITKLDVITAGLQPEQVCTIAGDTGGGKTAFAMQVATLCAADPDGMVAVFNLEMSRKELGERQFVHLSKINSQAVKTGALTPEDFRKLQGAASRIHELPLYLEEHADSVRQIEARCRRLRARFPGKKKFLGVLDTLQLMGNSGPKENRAREVGMISKAIKRLAKKLSMTWILVSQLNRDGAKTKKDKQGNVLPPTIHDLKESGDIEQDSDIILLTHNPDEVADGDIDLYLAKQRNGKRAHLKVHWEARIYRFSDPEVDPGPAIEERRYVE